MKRQLYFFFLVTFSFFLSKNSSAQENFAGRFEKGDIQISVAYGFPSPLRAYFNQRPSNRDLTTSGIGPYFFKVEYAISNKISILTNMYYNFSDVNWMQNARNPATGQQEPYKHGVEVWEFGVGLRANYYFLKKKNWNCYVGVGAGGGYAELETYTLAPKERVYISFEEPSTWSFEGTVGARYFLANNIALFTELGIGQSWYLFEYYYIPSSIVQLGLTVKL